MCRQSVRGVDDRARKQSRLCVDGRHSKQLLGLQAVATLRQHVTGSLPSRPGSSVSKEEEKHDS